MTLEIGMTEEGTGRLCTVLVWIADAGCAAAIFVWCVKCCDLSGLPTGCIHSSWGRLWATSFTVVAPQAT